MLGRDGGVQPQPGHAPFIAFGNFEAPAAVMHQNLPDNGYMASQHKGQPAQCIDIFVNVAKSVVDSARHIF
jgi:hypothetical protein